MPRIKSKGYRETDRILNLDTAKPILEHILGRGWSRSSITQKIREGRPFRWVNGLHYFKIGAHVKSVNVDAIIREITL